MLNGVTYSSALEVLKRLLCYINLLTYLLTYLLLYDDHITAQRHRKPVALIVLIRTCLRLVVN